MTDHVETLRESRKRMFFKLEGDILFSDAFKAIAREGQTVTTYLLILSRQPIPPNRKERIRLEKAGQWPPKDTVFSFPVREAPYHGLTVRGLAAGLQRLHEVGLIDRIKPGSARKGDYALYRLSERWRQFGKPAFNAVPWPTANTIGVRGEGGRFVKRRARKFPVVVGSATTEAALVSNSTTTEGPVVVNSTMNTCGILGSVVAESTMFLSYPSTQGKHGKKVRASGKRVQGAAAPRRRLRFVKPKVIETEVGVASWT